MSSQAYSPITDAEAEIWARPNTQWLQSTLEKRVARLLAERKHLLGLLEPYAVAGEKIEKWCEISSTYEIHIKRTYPYYDSELLPVGVNVFRDAVKAIKERGQEV